MQSLHHSDPFSSFWHINLAYLPPAPPFWLNSMRICFLCCFVKEEVHEGKHKNLHKSCCEEKDLYSVTFEKASAGELWLQ